MNLQYGVRTHKATVTVQYRVRHKQRACKSNLGSPETSWGKWPHSWDLRIVGLDLVCCTVYSRRGNSISKGWKPQRVNTWGAEGRVAPQKLSQPIRRCIKWQMSSRCRLRPRQAQHLLQQAAGLNQLSCVFIRSQGKGRDPEPVYGCCVYYNYGSYLAI